MNCDNKISTKSIFQLISFPSPNTPHESSRRYSKMVYAKTVKLYLKRKAYMLKIISMHRVIISRWSLWIESYFEDELNALRLIMKILSLIDVVLWLQGEYDGWFWGDGITYYAGWSYESQPIVNLTICQYFSTISLYIVAPTPKTVIRRGIILKTCSWLFCHTRL